MQNATNILGGVLLVIAGIHQWTPGKDACLANANGRLFLSNEMAVMRPGRHG
jgi:predicted metal-binding membrane protein